MKFSNGRIVLLGLLASFSLISALLAQSVKVAGVSRPFGLETKAGKSALASAGDSRGPKGRGPSFKAALAEAGLEYGGESLFVIGKDYRRGGWKGARPAFWTLTASDGAARLRLELTKNISRGQAEKTMAGRFLRIDALYSGGAAYPGMVTTEFEVPPQLRPRDLRTGPGENRVKVLSATPGLAYGAGSEDLVSHRGLLGYVYCEKTSMLAQIELFFPKADFLPEAALKEFDRLGCAGEKRRMKDEG